MKKKLLALLLLICVACGSFVACDQLGATETDSTSTPTTSQPPAGGNSQTSENDETPPVIDPIDYASTVTLDMTSETIKQAATVKIYIDGDTTHFNVPKEVSIKGNGVLKARYLAVNTPESTGQVEEWGKAASNFTKSKLQSATSIILETDTADWEIDSTGDRHLVWVWYRTAENQPYRNLNIEILQNGLALASDSQGNRYGQVCGKAIEQAQAMKLHVYSDEKDPDFYYGDAIPVDLKELRLNVEKYNNKKVAFEGVFTYNDGEAIYIENYDEETEIWYGMYVYYGFKMQGAALEILKPGNHVRVVGTVQYYEAGDSYQVSGIEYDRRNPDSPNTMKLLDTEYHAPANVETTMATFNSSVQVELEVTDENEETTLVTKTYKYTELALNSSISMKSLKVVKTYTTNNGGNNDGAISITCQDANGNKITVRTAVLRNADGSLVTEDIFQGKTIDVKGVIDYYKPENGTASYQIGVFDISHITIH